MTSPPNLRAPSNGNNPAFGRRLGVMMRIFCLLCLTALVPTIAFARPLPPLACESIDGDRVLGIYGAVAQLRTPEVSGFSVSDAARAHGVEWPAYLTLDRGAKTLSLRLQETNCRAAGGSFPLRAELYDPAQTAVEIFCCTVAE